MTQPINLRRTSSPLGVALALALALATIAAKPAEPISADQNTALLERFLHTYDAKQGGWSKDQKRLEGDNIELAMGIEERGAVSTRAMAQKTLLNSLALIDPVWGGAYACSNDGGWKHPLFAKRTVDQASAIRVYALATATLGSKSYVDGARAIAAYVEAFLIDERGAFYAGQAGEVDGELSADQYFALSDGERRRYGVPELDRRVSTADNGEMIGALATLYAVTGDRHALELALRAANTMIAARRLPGGGFKTDDGEAAPLALADSLAMGRAMLELYVVTAEERWLAESEDAAQFIARTFGEDGGGFAPVLIRSEDGDNSEIALDPLQNASVARFMNLLHHETENGAYAGMAEHAMRALNRTPVLDDEAVTASLLLASRELSTSPRRMIIVGDRKDVTARALHRAALARVGAYRTLEWVEPGPAPLRYATFDQPRPNQSAAISCIEERCAPPAFSVASIEDQW